MSGLIHIEQEILGKNPFGSFFIGTDKHHFRRVEASGVYPARRGSVTQNITIAFHEVPQTSYLQGILPNLYSLYIRAIDYMEKEEVEAELLGKASGFNIGSWQIESLGGKQSYVGGRVRMFSFESMEEATRQAKRYVHS